MVYKQKGRYYIAFDDELSSALLPDLDEDEEKGWLFQQSDLRIGAALERAHWNGRIAPVENWGALFPLAEKNSTAFQKSKLVAAAIEDLTSPFAAFLQKRGYSHCDVILPEDVEVTVPPRYVSVQPVIVGEQVYEAHRYHQVHYSIIAALEISDRGFARGVRPTPK